MRSDSDIAIRVEGLGKKYLVPQKHQTGATAVAPTLRTRLKEFFPALLGAGETDYFWALRGASFEIKRGEVLGIIGENGSGKSTLLKILSGVTPPSEGRAFLQGRVGSLLEVGTGFHPDLTGRENIFFNGALLGLSTAEIRAKLDEIIDFSGIEDFIDVPVKRYSSGMYVRLAYSVASLLESDILILDEVLAVGDEGFRNKSKQNMRARASDGSTVLFVSHNLTQVREICDRCVMLEHGRIVFAGTPEEAAGRYWREQMNIPQIEEIKAAEARGEVLPDYSLKRDLRQMKRYSKTPHRYLRSIEVFDPDNPNTEIFKTGGRIGFRLELEPTDDLKGLGLVVGFSLHNSLVQVATKFLTMQNKDIVVPAGTCWAECIVDDLRIGAGEYSLAVDLSFYEPEKKQNTYIDALGHTTFIRVSDRDFFDGRGVRDSEGAAHHTRWTFRGSH